MIESLHRRFLSKVECNFKTVECASSREYVLSWNSLRSTSWKRTFRNKIDKISAGQVKIIDLDYSEAVSPPTKKTRIELLKTASEETRITKKSLSNSKNSR